MTPDIEHFIDKCINKNALGGYNILYLRIGTEPIEPVLFVENRRHSRMDIDISDVVTSCSEGGKYFPVVKNVFGFDNAQKKYSHIFVII